MSSIAGAPEHFDVAVVGGGFSGLMVALNTARSRSGRTRVAIMERRAQVGRGIAYAEQPNDAILNVPAKAMGAFPDRPDDFARWLGTSADPAAYVPRRRFGDYLATLLADAQAGGDAIACLHADITAVRPGPRGRILSERGGRIVATATRVVLAAGAPAPADLVEQLAPALRERGAYVGDPWSFLAAPRFAPAGDIVIAGSGLTALDVIAAFARGGGPNRVQVISRGGRFPLPHAAIAAPPARVLPPGTPPATVRELTRLVRSAVRDAAGRGVDWRSVMDGLRPSLGEIWSGLDLAERRRFLRHLRPLFDPHRHRAPAELLAHSERLAARGRLTVRAGRIVALRPASGGIEVTVRPRGADAATTLHAAQVINCGGPSNDYARSTEPLLRMLLDRGDICADPTGLGLRAAPDGRLIDAHGRCSNDLFVIGWPMRGVLLETTAVRELREHAARLGHLLAAASEAHADAGQCGA